MSLGTQQSGGSLKPEYLCAWTMKGKYFANSIRLEAKQKVGMSYALISAASDGVGEEGDAVASRGWKKPKNML